MADLQTELKGLTPEQVEYNRQTHGGNVIPHKKPVSKLRIFVSQFMSPLVLILAIAAVVTFLIGETLDFGVIVSVILLNASLGFLQENRAQDALEALQKIIKPHITVIRSGQESVASPEELVMGDVVRLKLGDRVPADGVVLTDSNLTISEAVLTGESSPVEKEAILKEDISQIYEKEFAAEHKVFMGTTVLSGYGMYQITQIGLNTQFGKIATTLSEGKETTTPLQQRLIYFSERIAIAVAVMAVLVFVLGFVAGGETFEGISHYGEAENSIIPGGAKVVGLLTLSVSLAVSAIPEGMAISLTVILTVSMQRLLKRRALVRKLIVAETLGSVTTICVDKTGTLTEGKMAVVGEDILDKDKVFTALSAVNKNLNAVDTALLEYLGREHVDRESLFKENPQLREFPFNSARKAAASIHSNASYVVGAPEVLLETAEMSGHDREKWLAKVNTEAEKGHRLVGVGYKSEKMDQGEAEDIKFENVIKSIVWLGFIIIQDPPRKDVLQAFKDIENAGIKLKVITGDQQGTAKHVMLEIGVEVENNEMISGKELSQLNDDELKKRLAEIKLFYRTTPDQKLRIVEILQANGEVVGMMGDGINDAPALKRANVGIAVDNATEVSKETADIVLLETKMQTIVAAIEEGRTIFENLRKVITYLLSDSTGEVMLVLGSIIFGLPLPLLPLQILYINLVADGLPDIALAFEPVEKEVMQDKPRKPKSQLVDKEMSALIFTIGVVVNIFMFIAFVLMHSAGRDINEIRSFIFALFALDSLLYVYSIRSLRKNIWDEDIFENKILNIAVLFGLVTIIAAFYVPVIRDAMELRMLGLYDVIGIIILSAVQMVCIEVIKKLFAHRL